MEGGAVEGKAGDDGPGVDSVYAMFRCVSIAIRLRGRFERAPCVYRIRQGSSDLGTNHARSQLIGLH